MTPFLKNTSEGLLLNGRQLSADWRFLNQPSIPGHIFLYQTLTKKFAYAVSGDMPCDRDCLYKLQKYLLTFSKKWNRKETGLVQFTTLKYLFKLKFFNKIVFQLKKFHMNEFLLNYSKRQTIPKFFLKETVSKNQYT